MQKTTIRYIPVGDSYTIGEGIPTKKSWPFILTTHLQQEGFPINIVENPSQTGWTTQQAIDYELPIFSLAKPTFSTLLIGVNDWVQEVNGKEFHKRLVVLMDKMQAVLPNKNAMILITIPDFSATPNGKKYAKGRDVSQGISEFNEIIKLEGEKRRLSVVDIFPLTQQMRNNSGLIAQDGLHPSAQEYALWEKLVFPEAYKIIQLL